MAPRVCRPKCQGQINEGKMKGTLTPVTWNATLKIHIFVWKWVMLRLHMNHHFIWGNMDTMACYESFARRPRNFAKWGPTGIIILASRRQTIIFSWRQSITSHSLACQYPEFRFRLRKPIFGRRYSRTNNPPAPHRNCAQSWNCLVPQDLPMTPSSTTCVCLVLTVDFSFLFNLDGLPAFRLSRSVLVFTTRIWFVTQVLILWMGLLWIV